MTPEPTHSIEEARDRLIGELREIAGLTMIGIGERHGRPCLTVYLQAEDKKTSDTIPSESCGWPVDVRVSGPVRALEDPGE